MTRAAAIEVAAQAVIESYMEWPGQGLVGVYPPVDTVTDALYAALALPPDPPCQKCERWRAAAEAWVEWDDIAADDGMAEEADSLLTEARRLTAAAKGEKP